MRFIHAADLHLDSPLAGLRGRAGERAEDVAGATRRAFEGLVDFAVAERVALVVIAGDVFDGDWPDYTTGVVCAKGLGRLVKAGIPVAMVRGNHDAANRITRRLTWPPGVREFGPRSPETWVLDGLGVAVHGQSFADRAVPENLAAAYPPARPGLFNIGLLHTSAEGRPGHDTYAPCRLEDLRAKGYDYWALGHVHTREVLCRDPYIVFPGNLQGRHINETGAKGFTLVTVEGGRVRSADHICVDVLRWERLDVDVAAAATLEDVCRLVAQALADALAASDGRRLATRIVLTGASPAHRLLVAEGEQLEEDFCALAAQAPGDVWVERVEVRTKEPAGDGLQAVGLDLRRLVASVLADPIECAEIRACLEKGLDRLPAPLRKEAQLAVLSEEHLAGIMAEAEQLLLHRLGGGRHA